MTNTNGPQVGADAVRAVSGDPPLVAAASASSLPPSPPSTCDAAVRPRATDVSPDSSPRPNAARDDEERVSDVEENSSVVLDCLAAPLVEPIAAAAVLPPLASYAGAGATASTEIGVALDGKEEEDAPDPPAQIGADFERMDAAIEESKKNPSNIEDIPIHPPQIASDFDDNIDKALNAASLERMRRRVSLQQEKILQQAQDPPTPAVSRVPSPPPTDQGGNPSNLSGQQRVIVRPPPLSMMPYPDEGADPPVSDPPPNSSMTMLEATPVDDQVYDGVPVGEVVEEGAFEKNKKIIIGVGMGLLIGAAVAVAVAVSSNNGSEGSNTIESKGFVLPTARPSESSSPSEFPSLRPTLRPSQSLAPSSNPSQSVKPSLRPTASSGPSQIPSPRPSSMPTPTPLLFCGEINILADYNHWRTSWTIQNVVAISGIPYSSQVVLQGTPEEKGPYRYEACLERGDYEFAIFYFDVEGTQGAPYYNVTFEGIMIAQGEDFGSEERVSFSLPSWKTQGLGFSGGALSSGDFFGDAVAFSADAMTIAVGAPGRLNNGDRPGHVKVYRREGEGSGWEQRGKTIHGEANGDNFGGSLSLSEDGTTLSIGAPCLSCGRPGQVKVYEWDEATLDYMQIGDTLYGTASGDRFGGSLDISNGKILAVGASAKNNLMGQVMVFAWDEASSNYKQRGQAIDGDTAGDWFGISVSLSGNGQKIAVGADRNSANGRSAGQVRVFEWDEATSNYGQLGGALLGDAARDEFGYSVSFSRDGTTLAAGAPLNSEGGQLFGQVKVFAWDKGASNFKQIGRSIFGNVAFGNFGHSVVLSSDGTTLAVGAPQIRPREPGYAEVYEWDKATSEYKRLGQSLSGEASADYFGDALALAGNGRVLAIGAPNNDRNGTDSGRVEVFDILL